MSARSACRAAEGAVAACSRGPIDGGMSDRVGVGMAGVKAWLGGWLAVRLAARLAVPCSHEPSERIAGWTGIESLCIPILHRPAI